MDNQSNNGKNHLNELKVGPEIIGEEHFKEVIDRYFNDIEGVIDGENNKKPASSSRTSY